MSHHEKIKNIKNKNGFIAALDQSGGSTPKALLQYGVDKSFYKNDTESTIKFIQCVLELYQPHLLTVKI